MKNSKFTPRVLVCIIASIIVVGALSVPVWNHFKAPEKDQLSYTAFVKKVQAGEIIKVKIEGDAITADGKKGITYQLYRPLDADLSKMLLEKGVEFSAKPAAANFRWFEFSFVLLALLPLVVIMKKMAVFGKGKVAQVDVSKTTTIFTDVAGADEAKTDLLETVEFLKDPRRFARLGGKMPKGVLLVGPPGTGKTLLARAVAGEAGVPFFAMSGSEFVEMYVGVGASRVRTLFAQARKAGSCIIFIDELDAVGRRRDSGSGGPSDERNQTLNQLLVEMDGFAANLGIVVIAATNRPEVLDPALLRPGRFDRQVVVGSPDIKGREEILKVHVRNVPLNPLVDLRLIARGTPGFSGADLANVVNEAAILAARAGKPLVDMEDFETARDKILMGAEKKSMVLSERAKQGTAYHEAGHVMVAKLVPGCDPVHKVSIIPRGRALGVTVQIPEEDIHCYTREMLIAHIKVLMGGRAAEDLIFNTTTTGAGNDLARATDMARKMVCEWGMSKAFGPVAFGNHETTTDNDGSSAGKNFSDATAVEIDTEIRTLVTSAYDEVRDLLLSHMEGLKQLSTELLAKETLDSAEIDHILALTMADSGHDATGAII
ncbi:ATP-dependent zinc metalloprotease FtsH [Pelotalea chapellei]|uniref:ATP-dependent zinc metalloprotease FtsH n=1 Tax=Pelotalea chapellei TaxID=44671 RepID=A0ABS5U6W6_9BACT|nr:ATP-dependent zinc metalloprotease FtsH [Pelotalea chapellei]MBT1071407.1 ATP-dependent zinc metalloprotease FtsH [Pelotalea chapellei]